MPATNRGKDGAPTGRAQKCGRKNRPLHPARSRPWSLPIRRSARRVYGSITLAEPWLSTSKSTIFQSGLRVFTPDSRGCASMEAETSRFGRPHANKNIFIHFNCLTAPVFLPRCYGGGELQRTAMQEGGGGRDAPPPLRSAQHLPRKRERKCIRFILDLLLCPREGDRSRTTSR